MILDHTEKAPANGYVLPLAGAFSHMIQVFHIGFLGTLMVMERPTYPPDVKIGTKKFSKKAKK
nr:hypothetical protein [uncultured Gemmiger sp.]